MFEFSRENMVKNDIFDVLLQCVDALQSSPLTEAAELLDLLSHIELESLLFAHDKLAERQVALPWAQCVAEMWTKDRPSPSPKSSVSCTFPTTTDTTTTATAAASAANPSSAAATTVPPSTSASSKSVTPAPAPATSSSMASSSSNMVNNTSMDMTRVVKILKQNEPLVRLSNLYSVAVRIEKLNGNKFFIFHYMAK